MSKQEFLAGLRKGLSGLPPAEIRERLAFYSEMIDDRTEEGLTEEEAVAAVGSLEEILNSIQKPKEKKSFKVWTVVLLILGSPLWLSLLAAAFAVTVSVYVSLWTVIISLWAVFSSLVGCFAGGVIAGVAAVSGGVTAGVALLGAGLVCGGLAILMFFACKFATDGMVLLTKWLFRLCFRKKEAVV